MGRLSKEPKASCVVAADGHLEQRLHYILWKWGQSGGLRRSAASLRCCRLTLLRFSQGNLSKQPTDATVLLTLSLPAIPQTLDLPLFDALTYPWIFYLLCLYLSLFWVSACALFRESCQFVIRQ